MARPIRIQYPGATYHVMARGTHGQEIFQDDQDRQRFLETPEGNLVAGMKWLLGTYTGRFNRRHKEFGHLFSGRYKALIVDGSGNGYLKTVCDYVHLNPARAKVLKAEEPLSAFVWSSYAQYLAVPARGPNWLRVDRKSTRLNFSHL